MRVAITGAAGFFGLALTRAVALAGHQVLALDLPRSADFPARTDIPAGQVDQATVDITDRAALFAALSADVDAVVHAAALTPTARQQQEDPEGIVDVNLGGTISVFAAARRIKRCRTFIYISSAGVYRQDQPGPVREADADGGAGLYGSTKLAAEQIVRRYGLLFGIETVIVRPTSLYGPGEQIRPTRPTMTVVQQLVDAARRGQSVRIEGREARCDWVYVDDAADVVCRLLGAEGMADKTFNLSSGRPSPFSEIVDMVATLLPLRIDPLSDHLVDGNPDRPASIVNERLRDVLDWQPCDLRTGLGRFIASLPQHDV